MTDYVVAQDFETALAAMIDSYRNTVDKSYVSKILLLHHELVEADEGWVFSADRQMPTLTSLTPATAVAADPTDITLSVGGTNFDADTVIVFNGIEEPTTLVSPTEITTGVKPSLFVVPAVCPVTVRSRGIDTDPLDFTFTATE